MTMTPTLQQYLSDRQISYDIVPHEPTMSSTRTAEACHISGDCLAKGVLIRNKGDYMLAVLPASHHVRLSDLQDLLGSDVEIAQETELGRLFPDCNRGAVPPVGSCYGLDMIIDESLASQPEIYFEAGDHATLVHMSKDQFAKLAEHARYWRFSTRDAGVSVH
jgi:Ala-tRNA(Pro) deacylase